MAGYQVTNEDYSKWNTRTTNLSNEDIYVNLQINNPPEAINPVPAFYSEYRNQPLMDDATNYKMAITNIYAPGTNIPLFKFVELLSNGQFRYAVTLRMVQDVNGEEPPAGVSNVNFSQPVRFIPFKNLDYDLDNNFVYNFNQLVLMVNDAFNRAFDALKDAYDAAGEDWDQEVTNGNLPNVAPKIVFNPETQLFSIVVPFLYNSDMTNPDPLNPSPNIPFIAISMNWNAYNWFQNLPAIAQDYRYESNGAGNPYDNVTLRIYNTGRPNALIPVQFYSPQYTANKPASFPGPAGNTWAYPTLGGAGDTAYVYNIEQQDQSLENISTVRSIVVRSSMPVRAEYINATNNSTSVGLVNILADFAVSLTQGSPILYTPSPVFRYIDCLSDYLNQLGYQLWWADQNGDEYPIMVSPGETVELKMVFTRK